MTGQNKIPYTCILSLMCYSETNNNYIDIHMPGVSVNETPSAVRKIVVKVKV